MWRSLNIGIQHINLPKICSEKLKIYLSHNRNKNLSNTQRFRKKCVSASHFKRLLFRVCSSYLPSSLKLLVIKNLQTLPTTGFKEACRRGIRLQSRRHTETTLRHSIRKMSTQWKWKLVRDLKGCKKNFCSTTAVKYLENMSLTLKHGLCKYSLILGLEGSVST